MRFLAREKEEPMSDEQMGAVLSAIAAASNIRR
jgi:hypothetical protein